MAFLSLLAGLLALLGAAGAYFRLLSPEFGFYLCLGGVFVIALNLPVTLVNFIRFGKRGASFVALLFGLAAVGALGFFFKLAIENPVGDINTDTASPPVFKHLTPRMPAAGMEEFMDPSLAVNKDFDPKSGERQKGAYPDIHSFGLSADPQAAFSFVAETIKKHHPEWKVVFDSPADLQIEFEAEDEYLHFVDDILLKIEPAGAESRLQIRSRARGRAFDFGVNAKRVREMITEIKQAAASLTPPIQVGGDQ